MVWCVCAPHHVYLPVCVCVWRKTSVSVGSLGAGLARCQTNALHYGPIYLINWATLSTARRCQYQPGPPYELLFHSGTNRSRVCKQSPTRSLMVWSSEEECAAAFFFFGLMPESVVTSNTSPCRVELTPLPSQTQTQQKWGFFFPS